MNDYVTNAELTALLQQHADRIRSVGDEIKDELGKTRVPSKADLIGSGMPGSGQFGGSHYTPGEFLGGITDASANDAELQVRGKAVLSGLTSREEAWGKATLGTTDALGGWILPNALVEDVIKPAAYQNFYRDICTVIPGLNAATVDVPFRGARPNRAQIAPWGETKENNNLAYSGYTATMYTLARIHDIGVQFARNSRGAAERDVLGELATAFALGERYYIVQGTGTNEPYGLQTAITNAPPSFVTAHSPAATFAGSVAVSIGKAVAALLARDRQPNAAVLGTAGYTALITEGSNESGFYFAPWAGPEAIPGIRGGTLMSRHGIPVYHDSQLAEADDLIVGDFKALKLYFGAAYRVDTSTEAGDRWDKNLIGYRGEEEMGLDARPAVYAGAFQRVDDVTP